MDRCNSLCVLLRFVAFKSYYNHTDMYTGQHSQDQAVNYIINILFTDVNKVQPPPPLNAKTKARDSAVEKTCMVSSSRYNVR